MPPTGPEGTRCRRDFDFSAGRWPFVDLDWWLSFPERCHAPSDFVQCALLHFYGTEFQEQPSIGRGGADDLAFWRMLPSSYSAVSVAA